MRQPQHRQGDLLFIRQEYPPNVTMEIRPSLVILEGEATGHAHRLTVGTILETENGAIYLDLAVEASVTHDEHDTITLEPGLWLVVRQREYVPGAFRQVVD